ncbi:GATA zinc finger domain-containing protein 14-like, partial [Diaphorina citri]|uniref:GATA zinc finger domain-containing protein 14-like n=1 Tax=Diaphorina citri TaxID=121845 RepID=A0A1S4EQB9_DIACI
MEIREDGNEERTANEYRTEEKRKDVEDVASRFDETRKQHYKYEVGYKNKPVNQNERSEERRTANSVKHSRGIANDSVEYVDGQERDSTREENRNTISEINTSDELTCDHMNNISSEHRDYLPGESLSYETSLPQNTKGQQLSEPHLIKSSNRDKVDAIIADIMREDEASGPQELGGHRRTTIQGRNEQKSHKETAVQGIHKQGGHKRKMVQRSNEQAGRKRTIVEEMNEQTSHKITTVQRTNELAAHKRQTVERIKEQTLHKIGQRTNEQSHVETLDSTNLISDQATNQNQSIQTNPRDHISNQKPNQSVVDLTNSIYDAGYKGPLDQSIATASRGTNQSASQKDNYQNSNQTNRYANDSSVIDLTDDVCNEISQMEITNSIEVTQCSSQNKSDNRYGENSKHSNSCSNSQHYSNNYSNNSKHSNGCSNNTKHSSKNYSNNSKDSSNNCSNDKHSSNICSKNIRDYSNTYSNNIQHSNNTYSNN